MLVTCGKSLKSWVPVPCATSPGDLKRDSLHLSELVWTLLTQAACQHLCVPSSSVWAPRRVKTLGTEPLNWV